jgi:WD40 repeat protein
VAVAGNESGVAIHNFQTGERVAFLECAESPWRSTLAFSPDGSQLALGAQMSITVWETRTWKQTLRREDVGKDWLVVHYAPDGVLRAGRTHGWELRLWDVEQMRALFPPRQHESVLGDLAFSQDGLWVASVEQGGKAHVWSLGTGRKTVTVEVPADSFPMVAISQDGSLLVVATGASLRTYSVKSGDCLREISFPVDLLRALVLSPDGRIACIETNQALHLFRVDDGVRIGHQQEETGGFGAMDISVDDRVLATRGDGIVFWDIQTGKRVHKFATGKPFYEPSMSLREDRVYYDEEKNGVQVWDTGKGGKIETRISGTKLRMIQLFPDGSKVVGAAEDGGVWIVNVTTGERSIVLSDRQRSVSALALSADGQRLACGWEGEGAQPLVRLYNTSTGATEAEVTASIRAVAVSPNGRLVAFGDSSGSGWLWRPGSEAPPMKLWNHEGEVWTAAFSADGLLLACGGRDGKLRLWEITSARPLPVLTGHDGWVTGIRFLADGTRMVSVGADTTALLWDLAVAFGTGLPALSDWDAAWECLGRPEDANTFWRCLLAGDPAVKALSRRLAPSTEAELRPLLRRLESDDPAAREAAMVKLRDIGPRGEAILVKERSETTSPEVRSRLGTLLEELRRQVASTPEQLRWMRAVAILERTNTSEARALLRSMGTRASQAALERLKARSDH